jgi:hypothetical protein
MQRLLLNHKNSRREEAVGTLQKPKERKLSIHLSFRGVTTKA